MTTDAEAARAYAKSIRNERKRTYALDWAWYCLGKGPRPTGRGLSALAAQAVRMRLAALGIEEPVGPTMRELGLSRPGF